MIEVIPWFGVSIKKEPDKIKHLIWLMKILILCISQFMFHPGILHLQNTLQGILIFNIPSDLCYYNRRSANVKGVLWSIADASANGATEISLDATENGRLLYESMGFKASEECMVMEI